MGEIYGGVIGIHHTKDDHIIDDILLHTMCTIDNIKPSTLECQETEVFEDILNEIPSEIRSRIPVRSERERERKKRDSQELHAAQRFPVFPVIPAGYEFVLRRHPTPSSWDDSDLRDIPSTDHHQFFSDGYGSARAGLPDSHLDHCSAKCLVRLDRKPS